ncbi:hypothetical protein PENTCL1PPCAC_18342, partial [Pristionchus entomophagus]
RWMERDADAIIYSDEEPEQSDSRSEEEEEENKWEIDWDDMECVDEYGEDGDKETKFVGEESSEGELDDLLLDPVDELLDGPASKEKKEKERERRNRSMDDKKESDEEEEGEEDAGDGDPWSKWVGMDRSQEKKEEKEKEKERGEKR